MHDHAFALSRRSALRTAALAAAGAVVTPLFTGGPAAAAGYPLQFRWIRIAGPGKPSDATAWLAAMRQWRTGRRAQLGYDDRNYRRPELAWAQRNPVQPQMMVHDLDFYDRATGRYTVDKYLAGLRQRYGGIDSVLVWPTYPNIGVDDRNTDRMFRDLPGGIGALREMVADFHRAGVKVLFPIHPWDVGTRDPGLPWAAVLPATMAEIGADGLNGDTMREVTEDYFTASLDQGNPLVLEPELGAGDDAALQWNTQSWGYWNLDPETHQDIGFPYTPEVSLTKWLEPRHTVHVNNRWSTSKIDMLQAAFFNGTGLESWESIWGIWNQMTDRDCEATRRVSAIEREFADLLVSQEWEPHTPTMQNSAVFASKWPGGERTLWTLVNRSGQAAEGNQLAVPHQAGLRYYDVYHGVELRPRVAGGTATLSFTIEAEGFGAVLAGPDSALPQGFGGFLREMRRMTAKPLSSFSTANITVPQKMTPIRPAVPRGGTPPGMVAIPAADFPFTVSGTEIEGPDGFGVDVQYPWESRPARNHSHVLSIRAFHIDRTEVTNEQYRQFLAATGYHPRDDHNFLKDWDWPAARQPRYRSGWAAKPVTWVSIEDARAYADWAGKRLPNEWEWQYAAQGLDGRIYPWGSTFDASRVPATTSTRDGIPGPADVTAHPAGASPFGVLDLVGNVWQWTNEFTDRHTAAAVVRGGSYYRPQGASWYFPSDQDAYRLDRHNKYLLMAPSLDRSATIGFRTVADGPE
ncbi:formylglycine-generating enzyme family protein [Amycolatopsis saalfeldensis]|uniref:Formylglycine-generating enzyme, required for sulfatase activity, contains SUMF1/FGE domain n=1 Tax=Amycolatopsis saalfeldensis TaxID=394193 RepID=A0A1H8W0E2_9PSEU|nr:SUMF1/EgtB/PvdO family nonheme iron enzyme [Amycolatopsis saalfeldensis]SEP21119.1 Formylglycine-generating enzyme, required for sulfatase activity, contains SUMF1/FGE domain [Amycolatopsis saalfeldensis]